MTLVARSTNVQNAGSRPIGTAPGVDFSERENERGRYRIELAGREDDAALRALMRTMPMSGPIEVSLRREPSFFDAAAVEGPFHQVLVARETNTRRIVGMGSRSVRLRWVDGRVQPVGYLGGLRLLPEARHATVLARGYRELARLHGDGRTAFYLTTIAEANQQAIAALTGTRAGLPLYHELGRYLTFVLPVRQRGSARRDPDLRVTPLGARDIPALVEFVNATGRDRLFVPHVTAEDFGPGATTFRGLELDRVFGAFRGDRLVGTLAAWDQSSFRQTVVERYRGSVRWWKPFYGIYAAARGWPRFPAPGSPLRNQMLALPIVRDDDGDVFLHLIEAIQRLLRPATADSLLLGLFERDPLVQVVRPLALHAYVTRVFVVTWDAAVVNPERFDRRNLYLELGCL
jgi:hypothetical protein